MQCLLKSQYITTPQLFSNTNCIYGKRDEIDVQLSGQDHHSVISISFSVLIRDIRVSLGSELYHYLFRGFSPISRITSNEIITWPISFCTVVLLDYIALDKLFKTHICKIFVTFFPALFSLFYFLKQ